MNARWMRNGFIYLVILVAIVVLVFQAVSNGMSRQEPEIPLSDAVSKVQAGEIQSIVVEGDTVLHLKDKNDKVYTAHKEANISTLALLRDYGVSTDRLNPSVLKISSVEPANFGNIIGVLFQILPIGLLIFFFIFMMRQAQGSNNQAMSFGKSRARMFTSNRPTVTFSDVAGAEESKQELAEVVEFLKYPEKFASLGARIPRGVLLVGPPGTGKTLLARAVAGEAGVPFFSISGSEFVEMFVGVGASRVRDLFDQAKRNAPCIIFVDEIDAVGRQRGAGLGGSHDEREQTLNQILVEMDGFDTNTSVIVIAATNRPDILDPALMRPGRFDRQVVLDRPDLNGRRAILDVHIKGKPLDKTVSLDTLAKQTPGFAGADLMNLVNEAAILAARRNKKTIGMNEFEEAIDRVIAGPERKSRIISDREKKITAYHEVGHALVAKMLPNADPVYKITIIPRGMMGGYTRYLPDEDRHMYTKSQFEDMLASMLGGHAAEKLMFGEVTTGAESDIQRATGIARRMVCEFGMSRLGPVALGRKEELVFLGREISEQKNYSEKVAEQIDEEVHNLIDHAYNVATEILGQHREKLVKISEYLIKEETIERDTFEALMQGATGGSTPPPQSPAQPPMQQQPELPPVQGSQPRLSPGTA